MLALLTSADTSYIYPISPQFISLRPLHPPPRPPEYPYTLRLHSRGAATQNFFLLDSSILTSYLWYEDQVMSQRRPLSGAVVELLLDFLHL